jgi:hypothetical protein
MITVLKDAELACGGSIRPGIRHERDCHDAIEAPRAGLARARIVRLALSPDRRTSAGGPGPPAVADLRHLQRR